MPAEERCVLHDTESNKPNIIVTLITDIILLLIMLIGLLRLRRYGVGTFGLGQLLWKQVGISKCGSSGSSFANAVYKGVIWLFIATIAEVTPVVCPGFVVSLHISYCSTLQVFISLDLNGICLLRPDQSMMSLTLISILLQTQTRLTLYVYYFATPTYIE